MGIERDIFEEKYGSLINAVEEYTKNELDKLKDEHKKIEDSLNFKLKNLQEMFLNVCRHVYMLKAGTINVDQLVSIVNGCLDPRLITEFTWLYLKNDEQKKKELSETYKKVDEYNKNYLNDLMAELKLEDVDKDSDEIELIKDENGRYKVNFNPEATNTTMQTFNNCDDLDCLDNPNIVNSSVQTLVSENDTNKLDIENK